MFWDPPLISWIVLLLTLLGQPIQRTPARTAQQGSTSLPGYNLGARAFLPKEAPLRSSIPRDRQRWAQCHYLRPLERGGGMGA